MAGVHVVGRYLPRYETLLFKLRAYLYFVYLQSANPSKPVSNAFRLTLLYEAAPPGDDKDKTGWDDDGW